MVLDESGDWGAVMQERLIITDIAAVDAGVTIAGYASATGRAIRPVPPDGGGIPWGFLLDADGVPIEPFTEVDIDLGQPRPHPPHAEDYEIDGTGNVQVVRRLAPDEQRELLMQTLAGPVSGLFGVDLVRRRFARPDSGQSSLGTVRVREIGFINLDADKQLRRDRYDLEFRDESETRYSLRATDLAFREYCRRVRGRFTDRRDLAAMRVRERLNQTDEIYLRVGLSRPFPRGAGPAARCYLVITGIYTFPSYLDSRWADYFPAPRRSRPIARDERDEPAVALEPA